MKKTILILVLFIIISSPLYAAQSTITDAEGYACMGDDKTRRQTEQQALTEAKRNAAEKTLSYLKSETQIKDFQLEKDVLSAYANSSIKIIQELEKSWYKDLSSGDCYRMKIKAEVTPDEKAMLKITTGRNVVDDPAGPLTVQVWTGKKDYKQGEKIKVYLKGNKPFYARLLYKDASGNLVQLLPNPFRKDNYFNGGVIYELPSGNDKFDLEVSPPFCQEDIILYASTVQLGDLRLENRGEVYGVKTVSKDIGISTRGVKVLQVGNSKVTAAAEFFEERAVVNTGRDEYDSIP
ncbi:MAG: DUF4384 domain-containing protein [Deltaproteobacteria bacterium]|nr:DUF4384 domain-containing protein [Deltaproteobacteria bacterium]